MSRTHLPAAAHLRLARLCALAAIAACAAAAWLASPPKAEAQDCGVRVLCLYSGVDWSGRVVTLGERELKKGNVEKGITEVDSLVKGRVTSWINTTTLKVCGLKEDESPFSDSHEVLWTGTRFTRDPFVGKKANNETDLISTRC
jgi:hypothetical protein